MDAGAHLRGDRRERRGHPAPAHLYTQEGDVQTDMKFGLNHYNNGMYSSKCINSLLLVSGQMGVRDRVCSPASRTSARAMCRHASRCRAPRVKCLRESALFLTGPTSATTLCTRARSLARISHQVLLRFLHQRRLESDGSEQDPRAHECDRVHCHPGHDHERHGAVR